MTGHARADGPASVTGHASADGHVTAIDGHGTRATPERYGDLADRILAAPPRLGPVRLVAVDGPAGSGKTTFAARLVDAFTAAGVEAPTVHTDDLLEGWADLVSFWPRLAEWVLDPLRAGEPARYRRYDWEAERFGDDWQELAVPPVLVLEGVTSARAAIRPELTMAVFVTAEPDRRLARGIARDGEQLRDQWVRWMLDEQRHFTDDRTAGQVDLVVDGDPEVGHDPHKEYVRLRMRG